jgi:hypothetical protein
MGHDRRKDPDQDVRTDLIGGRGVGGPEAELRGYGETAWDKRRHFASSADDSGRLCERGDTDAGAVGVAVDGGQVFVSKARFRPPRRRERKS